MNLNLLVKGNLSKEDKRELIDNRKIIIKKYEEEFEVVNNEDEINDNLTDSEIETRF